MSERRDVMQGITDAVQKLLDLENINGIMVDWSLVTAVTSFDTEDGESSIGLWSGPIAAPSYRIRGLLHEGLQRLDEDWMLDDDDDE